MRNQRGDVSTRGMRHLVVRTVKRWRGAVLLTAIVAACLAPWHGAQAYQFKALYTFCAKYNPVVPHCPDGDGPGNLVRDAAGNLYGITLNGGAYDFETTLNGAGGVVFELTPNTATGEWTEKVLHSFCKPSRLTGLQICPDGNPVFGLNSLIIDKSGNLFGATSAGGLLCGVNQYTCGVVFELTPDSATGKWTETVLYAFCPTGGAGKRASACPDGAGPTNLTMDDAGNLFGLAGNVVFELTYNATTGKWNETVLYTFCNTAPASCPDGYNPYTLFLDQGSFYGVTQSGGSLSNGGCFGGFGCGVAFKLTPNGTTGKWAETVLWQICTTTTCTDGDGGPMLAGGGSLFGIGKAHIYTCPDSLVCGDVFVSTYSATKKKWIETVLHHFCPKPYPNCPAGYNQGAGGGGLIMDKSGNLYGYTDFSAKIATGPNVSTGSQMFKLTPDVTTGKWSYTWIKVPTIDNDSPSISGNLIMDASSDIFATGFGAAFEPGQAGVFEMVNK